MEYTKRAFGVGWFFFTIGVLTIPIPHASTLSSAAGGIGTTVLIGSAIAWVIIRIRGKRPPSRVNVLRLLTLQIVLYLFPFAIVALATSGQTADVLFRGDGYNWQHWTVHLLSTGTLFFLYVTSVEAPLYLHKYAPKNKVSDLTINLIPSWGSGISAALTGSFIVLTHFGDGPLAHVSTLPVIIAGVAVATLLLPFYKWIITRIWTSGVIDMFSFPRWKRTVFAVIDDVMSITGTHWFREHEPDRFMEHLKDCEVCQAHVRGCKDCQELYSTNEPPGDSATSER